MTIIADNLPV